jgi:hypothetical protein
MRSGGAGLSRALAGPAADTLTAAARKRLPIVAIDVPSGLMGDTGEALGAVAAVLTVTFCSSITDALVTGFRSKPGCRYDPDLIGRRSVFRHVTARQKPSHVRQRTEDGHDRRLSSNLLESAAFAPDRFGKLTRP